MKLPFASIRFYGAIIALLFAHPFSRAEGAAVNPIEGKWSGTLSHHDDNTAFGLELTRNEKGELVVAQFLPATHIAGYSLGVVTPEGEHYRGNGLDLTRHGDRLEGTFTHLKLAVSLQRAKEVPQVASAISVPAGPEPAWSYTAKSALWATPTIADGVVYVGSADGILHAVRLSDGNSKWTHPTGGAIYGETLVADKIIYVANDSGLVLALDCATGHERWRVDLGGGAVARELPADEPPYAFDYQTPTPVLADGVIYIGTADGGCHAIDAATGKSLWRFAATGKIRTTALVVSDRVIFSSLNQFVSALDRKTGTLAWQVDVGGAVTASPVLAAGNIIVGTRSYMIVALNPADGTRAWERFQWLSWVESTPRLRDNILYVGSSDNRVVRALAAPDGRTIWSTDLDGWAWARPAATADTVYASCAGPSSYPLKRPPVGSLSAIDLRTGALKWRHVAAPIAGMYLYGFVGGPAVAGDRVVAAGLDGTLQAFPISRSE